jgi:hypothetical protein
MLSPKVFRRQRASPADAGACAPAKARMLGTGFDPAPDAPNPPRLGVEMSDHDGTAPEALGADLLRGIKAIAQFLGESERRCYYLVERGLIPCGKEGASLVASRAALRAHYARITGGGA